MALDSKRLVVIQNRNSGLYLAADNSWIPDILAARHFDMGIDAYEFACNARLFDCDIIIRPNDTTSDIRMPVSSTD